MKTINKQYGALLPILSIAIVFAGCSSSMKVSLDVPDKFSEQATRFSVDGAKGVGFAGSKTKLRFGNYDFYDVKRGWAFSKSVWDKTSFAEAMEQTLLKNFGIEKGDFTATSKDKYQFSLNDDNSVAHVFCMEKTVSNSTRIGAQKIGEINTMNRQHYSFGATIIPEGISPASGWFLELCYDQETPGGMLATVIRDGLPIERGFITNKTDTIIVKPVFVKKAANPKNGKTGNFPIALLGGYEFRIGDGVAAIVDIINDGIWFYNRLQGEYKMVIAAASSAILLRRDK